MRHSVPCLSCTRKNEHPQTRTGNPIVYHILSVYVKTNTLAERAVARRMREIFNEHVKRVCERTKEKDTVTYA